MITKSDLRFLDINDLTDLILALICRKLALVIKVNGGEEFKKDIEKYNELFERFIASPKHSTRLDEEEINLINYAFMAVHGGFKVVVQKNFEDQSRNN